MCEDILYQVPKLRNLIFLMHSVLFSGGGPGCVNGFFVGGQIWEDYGLEILVKTPGLYQVLKMTNLNFCCCTLHLRGGSGCVKIFFFGGMGVRGGKTMDLRSSQKPQVSIKSQS